jgi:hypothetical protein
MQWHISTAPPHSASVTFVGESELVGTESEDVSA